MNRISNRKSTVKAAMKNEYLFAVKSATKILSTEETTRGAPMTRIELLIYAPTDTGHKRPVGLGFDDLIRHSKTETNVCQFFKAIGALDHAQAVTPNWGKVPGAMGGAMFYPENIEGKTVMKILRYLDPDEVLTKIFA